MAEIKKDRPVDLGIYHNRPATTGGLAVADKIALTLSALWLVGVGIFFFLMGTGNATVGFDPLRFLVVLIAIFMPVALFWVAATAANSARTMRDETARLHIAIDGIRQSYIAQQKSAQSASGGDVAKKLNEIAEAQKKTETTLAMFTSIRPAAPERTTQPTNALHPGEEQASLALGTPADALAPPLDVNDFISALQFPENPEDKEGFRALRRALQDRRAAQLIQAAQDVLTLLSQDGIYMDDLRPDRSRPDVWRRFAQGERGHGVASLGGIRDRSSLALSAARMRQDTIFRDAAHHFLRKFDHTFAEFEETASDAEIVALTDTRTARAFMLLGRVTGTFD